MQVIIAEWYEWFFGQQATSHLCVSKAMQLFLRAEWGITATVFYDTPPTWFHRASLPEKHDLFTRIAADLNAPMHEDDLAYHLRSPYSQHHFDTVQDKPNHAEANGLLKTDHNVFTHLMAAEPQVKTVRPALVVSSTSWTVDEDFGILLQAALQYEQQVGFPCEAAGMCPPQVKHDKAATGIHTLVLAYVCCAVLCTVCIVVDFMTVLAILCCCKLCHDKLFCICIVLLYYHDATEFQDQHGTMKLTTCHPNLA